MEKLTEAEVEEHKQNIRRDGFSIIEEAIDAEFQAAIREELVHLEIVTLLASCRGFGWIEYDGINVAGVGRLDGAGICLRRSDVPADVAE